MTEQEQVIWQGRPSQWSNFNTYIGALLTSLCGTFIFITVIQELPFYKEFKFFFFLGSIVICLFPLTFAFWKYISLHAVSYVLTSERYHESYGVFSRVTNDLELYRVKDSTIVQPFALRMFGLGNIVLDTSDHSTPKVFIYAVPQVEKLQKAFRERVEVMRKLKGVREFD